MDKILCVGSACKDIFFPTAEGKIIETPRDILSQKKISFELGAKYRIENIHEALGGCAANVSCGLAKLGIGSFCAARTGKNPLGSWIKEQLKKNGVDASFLKARPENKGDLSAIIVDSESAERTIFSYQKSSGDYKITRKKIESIGWIFIGDIHGKWEDELEAIIELAKKEKKRIAFNPREANIHNDPAKIIQAIGLSEIVFVNKDEAIEIVSHIKKDIKKDKLNDEKFLISELRSLEAKAVAVTDGKRGAWAALGNDIYFTPGLDVPAVDSTGAGDSFSSAFLAAYIRGKDISECLKWGIINSASVVQHYGAILGLLDKKSIDGKIDRIEVKKV